METTITYNGTTYTVTDGVIHTPKGAIEYDGRRPIPVPDGLHAALRAKGLEVNDYCWWGGKALPTVLAAEAQRQLDEIETTKRAAIVGLDELETAIAAQNAYDEALSDAIYSGNGGLPARPDADVAALKRQYPIAAAYLHARAASQSAHYVYRAAGRKAMERIEAGEDHDAVLADMESEWSGYCAEHVWD